MPTPRLAKSLEKLRQQVDELAPNRSKDSDGWIGDAGHQARKSEHNPDPNGVVRAIDITHDPGHGVNGRDIAEQLKQSKDPRILYVISNRQIFSSVVEPWVWRHYGGSNPHTHHVHISVVEDQARYDDTKAWAVELSAAVGSDTSQKLMRPRIKVGDSNDAVSEAQRLLGLNVSGTFDTRMDQVVREFQAANSLEVDGIIGPDTWDQLAAAPGEEATKRQTGIVATVFGGAGEDENSAYDGHRIGENEFGVALPFRFKTVRPDVRVTNTTNGKSVVCKIVDVGPWNTDDPYWARGTRPQAENGIDERGRRTNRAGIDLTPAAARFLDIDGKGTVDWEFIGAAPVKPPAPSPELDSIFARFKDFIARLEGKKMAPSPETSPASVQPDVERIENAIQRLGQLVTTIAQAIPTDPALAAAAGTTGARPTLSPIDKALGGEAMVGLKTPLSILAYAGLWAVQAFGGVGTATGDKATTTGQVLTALIAAFGGLGVTAKIDRGVQALTLVASLLRAIAVAIPQKPKTPP